MVHWWEGVAPPGGAAEPLPHLDESGAAEPLPHLGESGPWAHPHSTDVYFMMVYRHPARSGSLMKFYDTTH